MKRGRRAAGAGPDATRIQALIPAPDRWEFAPDATIDAVGTPVTVDGRTIGRIVSVDAVHPDGILVTMTVDNLDFLRESGDPRPGVRTLDLTETDTTA